MLTQPIEQSNSSEARLTLESQVYQHFESLFTQGAIIDNQGRVVTNLSTLDHGQLPGPFETFTKLQLQLRFNLSFEEPVTPSIGFIVIMPDTIRSLGYYKKPNKSGTKGQNKPSFIYLSKPIAQEGNSTDNTTVIRMPDKFMDILVKPFKTHFQALGLRTATETDRILMSLCDSQGLGNMIFNTD